MLLKDRPASIAAPVEPASIEEPDAGVIEEARRRQRRHRAIGAALLAMAAVGLVLGFTAGGPKRRPPSAARSLPSLKWLTGPPLTHDTGLRLVAGSYEGPASIVDVDSGTVQRLPQLGVFAPGHLWGPSLSLYPLARDPGGALAVVTRRACDRCAGTEHDFLITGGGAVRRIATRYFPPGTTETTQVPGSTAEWALTSLHRGRCMLRLVPSTHRAVIVPCGDLGPASPAGVAIWTQHDQRGILVNPLTGVVRGRLTAAYEFDPVGHGLAIESAPEPYPGGLSLVNLATGHRLRLGWPSPLRFGYRVFPEAGGPLVAIEFADPAYPPPPQETAAQAGDVWLLDTLTGRLTHVPGFPALEYIKQSAVAWTSDHRLVIVAAGIGRTAIAVWRPGQPTLPVGTVPNLEGYPQLVPLS